MVLKIAVTAAFIFACCGIAAAQDVGGRYKSEGKTTTGGSFSVTAEIEMTGKTTCRIKFSDGFAGICILKDKTLAVATLVHGKAGLGVYELSSDGSFEGVFIGDFHGVG